MSIEHTVRFSELAFEGGSNKIENVIGYIFHILSTFFLSLFSALLYLFFSALKGKTSTLERD